MRRAGIAAAALFAVVMAAAAPAAPSADTGVRGTVLMVGCPGPVRRDDDCARPVAANVVVRRPGSANAVARLRSSPKGRFHVALRAGRYAFTARLPGPGRSVTRTVAVRRHATTRVTLRVPSGML